MAIVFGVLSYRNDSFEHASGNIGDFIQSLAAINCYRHALRLDMPFAEFLDRVLTDSVPGARFVFVNRDDSRRQSLPPRVITLMNGWFMHPSRKSELEWPMHESIEPVFVSFHCADDGLLTPAGIEYLKRFEPIGCRDTATVEKLRSRGIEAYFTGCLTLTIDFLPWTGGSRDELFVDVNRDNAAEMTHWNVAFKNRDPATMLRRAYALLKRYSLAEKVTTSRLHCFLPCVAMGVPVTLSDVDLRDPRLNGVDSWDYGRLRHSLLRDATDRLARLVSVPSSCRMPTFDVCFAFDERMAAYVPVVAHSILHNNRHARVRFHLVHMEGVGIPTIEGAEVVTYAARWDRPNDGLQHVSRATMLRLLIPDLVREDIRVLYLDVDLVVNMSLEPVFKVDPGPTGIAMKSSLLAGDGLARWTVGAGEAFPGEDRSRIGNAGVMLMDLATLRRNGFSEFCLKYPDIADGQLLINLYCRGAHAELNREWNLFLSQDYELVVDTDQFILHYAGPNKPWSDSKPDHWQMWNWYARRLRERGTLLRARTATVPAPST